MSSVTPIENETKPSVHDIADDLGIRIERIETFVDLIVFADIVGMPTMILGGIPHVLKCLVTDAQEIQSELYEVGGES